MKLHVSSFQERWWRPSIINNSKYSNEKQLFSEQQVGEIIHRIWRTEGQQLDLHFAHQDQGRIKESEQQVALINEQHGDVYGSID